MSNSYTPPDRSTYDPGWNDPPPMPTVPTAQAPVAGKRLNLNKRVAFPMQSSGAASSSNVKTTSEGLPLPFSTAKYQPPPMSTSTIPEISPQPVLPPPPPPSTSNLSGPVEIAAAQPSEETFDSASAEQLCRSTFARLTEAMATNTDAAKMSEIRKRLEVLNQMWKENRLNESVQKVLYDLATALENHDAATAMEQHRLLATQHTTMSSQWATALRQIILSISPESENDAETSPPEIPDTEVVQFVDVSSNPIVMDNIPTFPTEPQQQTPPELNQSDTQQTNETSSSSSENANPVNTNQNEPKSRFGRFGRILHI